MSEQDKDLVPQADSEIEPVGDPQEFGFPAKPTAQQRKCWNDQERFLRAYAQCGRPYEACRAAGVTVHAYHRWDDRDLYSFKKRMEMAEQEYVEKMERELDRRILEGYDKPLVWKGQLTKDVDGNPLTIKEFQPTDMYFRLKKLRPEYRDNYQPQTTTHVSISETIIHVHDYRSDSSRVVEGEARELPEEDKS